MRVLIDRSLDRGFHHELFVSRESLPLHQICRCFLIGQ